MKNKFFVAIFVNFLITIMQVDGQIPKDKYHYSYAVFRYCLRNYYLKYAVHFCLFFSSRISFLFNFLGHFLKGNVLHPRFPVFLSGRVRAAL